MLLDASKLSKADLQWGEMKAEQLGVSPVVTDENDRARIRAQTALILADVRDTKRKAGIPVPDEGTSITSS